MRAMRRSTTASPAMSDYPFPLRGYTMMGLHLCQCFLELRYAHPRRHTDGGAKGEGGDVRVAAADSWAGYVDGAGG